MTDADDQRARIALNTHGEVEPGSSLAMTHIRRRPDRGFDGKMGRAEEAAGAMFHEVVGQCEVSVVANERGAKEPHVGVIATTIDSERRAKPAGAYARDETSSLKDAL